MWAIKVDINLLNQHCKPNCLAGWLTNWLTEALGHSRRSRDSGTRALNWFKGHLDTWALKALEYLSIIWALKTLEHSGTWTLMHSKGTWAFGNSGTREIEHSRHSRHFTYQTPNYSDKGNVCYMDRDRFLVNMKMFMKKLNNIKKLFDTSNCVIDRPLAKFKIRNWLY